MVNTILVCLYKLLNYQMILNEKYYMKVESMCLVFHKYPGKYHYEELDYKVEY